ncbi:MAG TPA: SDR family NAD(P)-dependent oxidoreductase [Usitatibacter sp.]|jgi:NAD(P)-dependent dehydrogenase (short-subunit alcohol dehydrogenase family)|nr:SDR family NAD(P)-dependent oxidoreductase [Usitatibacter sp.]
MNDTAPFPRDYQAPPGLLAERVILVTGAGQGLGQAVALACARHGATVVLLGRKQEKLERTYDAITTAGGARPAIVPLDLATAGTPEFEELANLVRRDVGPLSGIAHCASHFTPLTPIANQPLEGWLTMLRVNLAAPVALTRACLPLLEASPGSSVVFTSETHALHPKAYWGSYAVSKAGLSTLAAIWDDELEHAGDPRMSVLVPGPIATPQRRQTHPAEDRTKLRPPEWAARAYLYLLGPESRAWRGRTVEL